MAEQEVSPVRSEQDYDVALQQPPYEESASDKFIGGVYTAGKLMGQGAAVVGTGAVLSSYAVSVGIADGAKKTGGDTWRGGMNQINRLRRRG